MPSSILTHGLGFEGGLVTFGFNGSEQSVMWLSLLAAQARIQALNLAGVSSSSVVIKKLALQRYLGSGKPLGVTLPAVVLWPVGETRRLVVNSRDDVDYRIGCATIETDNQEPTVVAGMPGYLQWRQQIGRAFSNQGQNSIPGLPSTVYIAKVQPSDVYSAAAWGAQLAVSYQFLIFSSREPRGLNA